MILGMWISNSYWKSFPAMYNLFIFVCHTMFFNFKNLTEQAIKLIVEKLILALFYNNMSLKGAFDCFDLNSNGIISKNEFFYGINSLELGIYK